MSLINFFSEIVKQQYKTMIMNKANPIICLKLHYSMNTFQALNEENLN